MSFGFRTSRGAEGWVPATSILAVVVVVAWWIASPPGANDPVGGDEGHYGTMARNLLADPRQWLAVSLTPLGPDGDKPPLVPALLAAAMSVGGDRTAAARAPFACVAALLLIGTGAIARRLYGPRSGFAAALVLAALPWFADGSRVVAAEPVVALCAVGGILAASDSRRGTGRALLAGICVGLAFLAKFGFAVFVAFPVGAAMLGARRREWLVAASAAIGVGALHLLAIQIHRPDHLGHWLNVALRFSLLDRAGGEGFAAYWLRGPLFYALTLAHALVLVLPFVALGAEVAWSQRRNAVARAVLAWAAGAVLLSVFRVKSGIYLHALIPAFAILAAWGFRAIATRERLLGPVVVLTGALTVPGLVRHFDGPAPALLAWLAGWALFALALLWAMLGGTFARLAALGVLTVTSLVGFARQWHRLPQRYHDVGYREVAAVLAPRFTARDPREVVLLAPEAPAFRFLLFRGAEYWDTPYRPWTAARFEAMRSDSADMAFVVDTSRTLHGGWPGHETLTWLASNAREVTADVTAARRGRPHTLRVFVRP